jgi:hypothetical protein
MAPASLPKGPARTCRPSVDVECLMLERFLQPRVVTWCLIEGKGPASSIRKIVLLAVGHPKNLVITHEEFSMSGTLGQSTGVEDHEC